MTQCEPLCVGYMLSRGACASGRVTYSIQQDALPGAALASEQLWEPCWQDDSLLQRVLGALQASDIVPLYVGAVSDNGVCAWRKRPVRWRGQQHDRHPGTREQQEASTQRRVTYWLEHHASWLAQHRPWHPQCLLLRPWRLHHPRRRLALLRAMRHHC